MRTIAEMRFLDVDAWQWLGLLAAIAAALVVGAALTGVGRTVARWEARRRGLGWDEHLAERAGGPGRLLAATATFALVERSLRLAPPARNVVHHVLHIAVVVAVCWAGLRGLRFAADRIARHAAADGGDAIQARARMTQVMVLRRIVAFVIVVVGGATVLLQFEPFRALGASLLASAGLAGIVAGLAAQRSLASLFAGVQISLTQPIRVGDVVVIEGETGTIEEITLTYVVVKVWDLRRLIVPITRFLDTPFQNWTRSGSAIVGTVTLHADYAVAVDAVRTEARRFVTSRPEWDGKTFSLDVSRATDRTVELTTAVSSADADLNGALRSALREHLIGWLQRFEGGRCLPRTRIAPTDGVTNVRDATSVPGATGALVTPSTADAPGRSGRGDG